MPASSLVSHRQPARLGAVATAVAVAVLTLVIALASPASAGAATPIPLPDSSQLTAALETLTGDTNATALAADITGLDGSASTATLTTLDDTLGTALGTLSSLLATLKGSSGEAFESTLSAAGALAPADATPAQQQAETELTTALTSAGISMLLSGLTTDRASAATLELTALQRLTPGSSSPAGDLASVAAIVAELAGETPSGPDATALSSAAATLASSSGLTPAQQQSVVSGLASVTSPSVSTTPGVTVGQVAQALAATLAQSGSLLGGLASLGSPVSSLSDATTVPTAVGQIAAMATLPPGAVVPLAGMSTVLSAVATTPGVSGTPSATTLNQLANAVSGSAGTPAVDLEDVASSLDAVATDLPFEISQQLLDIVSDIETSQPVFGTVSGLSPETATTALAELGTLAALAPGSSTPELPGIGDVLEQLYVSDRISDSLTHTAFADLIAAISTNPLTGAQLGGSALALTYIAADLPSPVSATVSDLSASLSADAQRIGATTTPAASGETPNDLKPRALKPRALKPRALKRRTLKRRTPAAVHRRRHVRR